MPKLSANPSGSPAMCRVMAIRRLVATRNAARCEQSSAAMYTMKASAENPMAAQPHSLMCTAWLKSGLTSSTSLIILQRYQNGTSAITALIPASTHER